MNCLSLQRVKGEMSLVGPAMAVRDCAGFGQDWHGGASVSAQELPASGK